MRLFEFEAGGEYFATDGALFGFSPAGAMTAADYRWQEIGAAAIGRRDPVDLNTSRLADPAVPTACEIEHAGRGLYAGLPNPLTVGRYHSFVVDEQHLPDDLVVRSRGGGVIMGLAHRQLPVEGVQFHPESVLTSQGLELLANWLDR